MISQLEWFKNWSDCLRSQRDDSFSMTQMIKKFNLDMEACDVNKILQGAGVIKMSIRRSITDPSKTRRYKTLTTKGKRYGYNQQSIYHPTRSEPRYTKEGFERLINDFGWGDS